MKFIVLKMIGKNAGLAVSHIQKLICPKFGSTELPGSAGAGAAAAASGAGEAAGAGVGPGAIKTI